MSTPILRPTGPGLGKLNDLLAENSDSLFRLVNTSAIDAVKIQQAETPVTMSIMSTMMEQMEARIRESVLMAVASAASQDVAHSSATSLSILAEGDPDVQIDMKSQPTQTGTSSGTTSRLVKRSDILECMAQSPTPKLCNPSEILQYTTDPNTYHLDITRRGYKNQRSTLGMVKKLVHDAMNTTKGHTMLVDTVRCWTLACVNSY